MVVCTRAGLRRASFVSSSNTTPSAASRLPRRLMMKPCRHEPSIKKYFSSFGGTSQKTVGPYRIRNYVKAFDMFVFCVSEQCMGRFREIKNYLLDRGPLNMIFVQCTNLLSDEECVGCIDYSVKKHHQPKKDIDPNNTISMLSYNVFSEGGATST